MSETSFRSFSGKRFFYGRGKIHLGETLLQRLFCLEMFKKITKKRLTPLASDDIITYCVVISESGILWRSKRFQ